MRHDRIAAVHIACRNLTIDHKSLWAQSLFAITPDGKRFEAEAARFQALPEPERARAIVRFVQDDVRYVGVEIGENSHRPHTPAWVLDRGFGDCKDKSLLLVSLLRAAGLEAWPSLVHASAGQRLPKSTPSPDVFNHAIVQVALKSGPRTGPRSNKRSKTN